MKWKKLIGNRDANTSRARNSWVVLSMMLLLLGACSSSDDGDAGSNNDASSRSASGESGSSGQSDDPEPAADPSPAAAGPFFGSGDFCETMAAFDESDPLDDVDPLSPEYFETAIALMGETIERAPGELKGPFSVIRDNFVGLRDAIGDGTEFDIFDPANADLLDSFDTAEVAEASETIDRYLAEECGIAGGFGSGIEGDDEFGGPGPSFDPSDFDEDMTPAEFYEVFFGVEPDVAECLAEELGDFEEASEDPNLLSQEFCGFTFMELLSQMGG